MACHRRSVGECRMKKGLVVAVRAVHSPLRSCVSKLVTNVLGFRWGASLIAKRTGKAKEILVEIR